MSVHAFPVPDQRAVRTIVEACHDAGRGPSATDWAAGTLTLTFLPDLSGSEADELAAVVRAAKSILSRAERDGLDPFLDTLRAFQQLSQSEFMAFTAAERDRRLFDAQSATIRVLRVLLRD